MRLEDLQAFVWRGAGASTPSPAIPTGFAALDRALPGAGWPSRAVTEVYVDRYGIGELRLLIPALKYLTRHDPAVEKKWIIFIAPPFIPYAPALLQHGVAIEQLLLVHPTAGANDTLWAVEQAVRSGSSSAVLAWVRSASAVALRRLQIAAEAHSCWTVLFRPQSALAERSPAALRVRLASEPAGLQLTILKCRGGRPAVVALNQRAVESAEEPSAC